MENKSYFKVIESSEKSFGIFLGIILICIFIYKFYYFAEINIILLYFSIFIISLSFLYPRIFYFPNKVWLGLGKVLGSVFAPIFMLVIFFLVITPMSFLIRIFKRDLLSKNFNSELDSYWVDRDTSQNTMDKPY